MIELVATRYTYLLTAASMAIGLYIVIASPNLVKKVIGMNLFQTAIFLLFISAAFVADGTVPVVSSTPGETPVANPLPHVIVLTAIVVGVAMTAVALALIVRIYSSYGTFRADVIEEVRADD